MKRILLLSLPGMGDTVMFSPVIRRLRHAYPDAFIAAVTMYPSSYQVLELDPALNRVECFDFMQEGPLRSLRFLAKLRRERFDASLTNYPSNRFEYHMVAFLAGAAFRAGHRYRHETPFSLSWLNNRRVTELAGRHNVDENLALADMLGVPAGPEPVRPYITLSDGDRTAAQRFMDSNGLTGKRVVALHTWSTELKNMHRKCWPPERFGELVRLLSEKDPEVRTVIFQGPHDAAAVRRTLDACTAGIVPVTAAGFSVRESAALLERCSLLVSNDSGVMHLCEAVGTPCLGLFGPTDPLKTAPYDRRINHVALADDTLPCRPCFYYSPRPLSCRAGFEYRCLTALSATAVAGEAQRMLEDGF